MHMSPGELYEPGRNRDGESHAFCEEHGAHEAQFLELTIGPSAHNLVMARHGSIRQAAAHIHGRR